MSKKEKAPTRGATRAEAIETATINQHSSHSPQQFYHTPRGRSSPPRGGRK